MTIVVKSRNSNGGCDMNILYKNIRDRRKDLNMSQDSLAKLVGYTSRSTIARIENGEIDLPQSKIVEFAQALRVTPAYLMGWVYDSEEGITPTTLFESLEPIEQQIMERVQFLSTGNQVAVLSIINQLVDAQKEEKK